MPKSELETVLDKQIEYSALPAPEYEYRFAAMLVGLGPGVRNRLAAAGLNPSGTGATNWTGTFADIDETSSNGDTDFIYTPDNPTETDSHIVHLGVVLIAMGITGSSVYQSEVQVTLAPGETIGLTPDPDQVLLFDADSGARL